MEEIKKSLDYSYLNIVEQNSDIVRVASYITEISDFIVSNEEAKRIAKLLIKQDGFSKDSILNHEADKKIEKYIEYQLMKRNSVIKEGEQPVYIPLKTMIKNVDKSKLKVLLGGLVGLSLAGAFAINSLVGTINNAAISSDVTHSIGMLASSSESHTDIVRQNTYTINTGSVVNEAYHNDRIAEDIIKICGQNPNLLDICLHNTYFCMNYNRLHNMDEVLTYLKAYTQNHPEYESIYKKLQDKYVFLDYVKNFVFKGTQPSEEIVNSINHYTIISSDYLTPYNHLTNDEKKEIDRLIDKYKDAKKNLYPVYKGELDELVDTLKNNIGGR